MLYAVPASFYIDHDTNQFMCEMWLVQPNGHPDKKFKQTVAELKKTPIKNNFCRINRFDKDVLWDGHTWNSYDEFYEFIELVVLRNGMRCIASLNEKELSLLSESPEHIRELLQFEREKFETEVREKQHKKWLDAHEELINSNTRKKPEQPEGGNGPVLGE